MCQIGEVAIGTLGEYTRDERHQDGVLDRDERKGQIHVLTGSTPTRVDQLSPTARDVLKHTLPGVRGNARQSNNVFAGLVTLPNEYIYCVSETSDWSARAKPEYDTCVVIKDPGIFFLLLTMILRDKDLISDPSTTTVGQVLYSGRTQFEGFEPEYPLWLRKDRGYVLQREWRGKWEPKQNGPPLEWGTYHHPDITGLVSLLKTRDGPP
jgi:hypothetical protein